MWKEAKKEKEPQKEKKLWGFAFIRHSGDTTKVEVSEWRMVTDNFIEIVSTEGPAYYTHIQNVLMIGKPPKKDD